MNWQDLAVGVACRVEFERKCMREELLSESSIVWFAAQVLQAHWNGRVLPEQPHPNIPRAKIDLVGKTPQDTTYNLALEAKYIDPDRGVREWLKEVYEDVHRLQHFTAPGINQHAQRIILIVGPVGSVRSEIFNRTVQYGGGSIQALHHLLPATMNQVPVVYTRDGFHVNMRPWLKRLRDGMSANLASHYGAQLVGHYATGSTDDSIEAVVWKTMRRQNWTQFDPRTTWP
jgi:hypothetical protein